MMTQMQDPMEIYRTSLAGLPVAVETAPPTIERVEVWPYPDLQRLWVRVQVGSFARFPDLSFHVTDPDGETVCTMYMVEMREPYQSLTLHLRRPPRPDAAYRLEVELLRDGETLDRQALAFDLTFKDPQEAKSAE